jgi:Lrp/AsnC family transcriptional regulator, leucine-responsive regulatory protein
VRGRNAVAAATLSTGESLLSSIELDEIDLKILQKLQEQARVSNVELADAVGLSPAPCLRRVRALEQARVIRKYVALVDPTAVNLGVAIFVQIKLDRQVEGRLEVFEQAIMRRPEVLECYLMTGDSDYLLRVVVPDVDAYARFLRDSLTRIESAAGIKSSFALKQVKYLTALPLSYAAAGKNSDDRGRGYAPSAVSELKPHTHRSLKGVKESRTVTKGVRPKR